jgi:hypothetical protein
MKGRINEVVVVSAGVIALMFFGASASAGEHGGSEHGGTKHEGNEHGGSEHGGTKHEGSHYEGSDTTESPAVAPSAEAIRESIRDYISGVEQDKGNFTIIDTEEGTTRTLTLEQVHERVGKTGDYYYSCTDMVDIATGETLDLDFDVDASMGKLEVVDVRIHKLDGEPRYTYDDNDNMISLQ